MNNIENMIIEMHGIEMNISVRMKQLDGEHGELLATICKVQKMFGNQKAGQESILLLSSTLKSLVKAYNSLNLLEAEIQDYIRQIKK